MRLSKNEIKELKDFAQKMPVMYCEHAQKTMRIKRGIDLITAGVFILPDGTPIDPKGVYNQVVDDGVRVNHYKRMLRIAETGNWESLNRYIKGVLEFNSQSLELLTNFNKRMQAIAI